MFENVINHIKSHYPNKTTISLHEPVFGGNEVKYLRECIDSTFVSYHGEFVKKFESDLAIYTGSEFCISQVNGTSALHVGLVALGVDSSCEVITQGLSFVATANAISYTGASPVFLDINKNNLGLSAEHLDIYLKNHVEVKDGVPFNKSTGKKVGACIPVHIFGHSCSIDQIVAICDGYQIPVIEDAAEALGSFNKEKHLGSFGKIGILSFNGNKIITTGGGGAVITSDKKIAEKILHLSTTAKLNHAWEYRHDEVGYNLRMPNVNAAIGCAQMERLAFYLESKRKLANEYKLFFDNLGLKFHEETEHTSSNYWLNAIFFDDLKTRNEFLELSHERGVFCRPAWELATDLPMYKHCFSDGLINARHVAERLVNIPSSVPGQV